MIVYKCGFPADDPEPRPCEDPNEDPEADGVAEEEAALTIYMKRNAEIETDRDILAKTTVVSGDEHYTVELSYESKVVLAKFKA